MQSQTHRPAHFTNLLPHSQSKRPSWRDVGDFSFHVAIPLSYWGRCPIPYRTSFTTRNSWRRGSLGFSLFGVIPMSHCHRCSADVLPDRFALAPIRIPSVVVGDDARTPRSRREEMRLRMGERTLRHRWFVALAWSFCRSPVNVDGWTTKEKREEKETKETDKKTSGLIKSKVGSSTLLGQKKHMGTHFLRNMEYILKVDVLNYPSEKNPFGHLLWGRTKSEDIWSNIQIDGILLHREETNYIIQIGFSELGSF